jgi:hypothetical protein
MINVVVEEIHYHLEEPLKVLCSDETREPLQDWASKLSKRLTGQQAFEAIDVDPTSADPSSPVTHEEMSGEPPEPSQVTGRKNRRSRNRYGKAMQKLRPRTPSPEYGVPESTT